VTVKLFLMTAAIGIFALLASACGGGDDNTNSPAASNGNTTATQTQTGGQTKTATAESTDNGNGGGELDVCGLISNDELSAVIGPAEAGIPHNTPPNFFDCEWDSSDHNVSVTINVYADTADNVKAYYELTTNGDDVSGLGDKAQWTGETDTLEVLKGTYDVSLIVVTIDDSFDREGAAKTLAGKALGRLP